MSEESAFLFIGLLVLAFPVLAIVAFVMTLGLRRRVQDLEERVRHLAGLRPVPVDAARAATPAAPAEERKAAEPVREAVAPVPAAVPAETLPAIEPPPPQARPEPVAAASAQAARRSAPPKPKVSLEEKLGTRWAVWVGGLALALGGAFLVRYAVEEELLGPGARILAGLVFSLALIGGGEYLRRRPVAPAAGQAVYIPGVVTAAGTVALFATVYAAYALYEFLSPAQAFVLLGLVGIATMYAAALHGPWLAGLGLVGAYGAPLLVSSNQPNPWALALYVVVVTAAAFMLARIRLWRWLAIAAGLAAFCYGFVLGSIMGEDTGAMVFYILALSALIGAVLIYEPHHGKAYQSFDPVGLGAVAGLAILAVSFAGADVFGHASLATLLIVMALALAAALAFDALAPAAVIAGLAGLTCLWIWPIDGQLAAEPLVVVPGHLYLPFLMPDALQAYIEIAIVPAAVLLLATTISLMRHPRPQRPALALALAGTAPPIFALAIAYLRIESLRASLPFGAVAAGLAVLFAATTERFLRLETQTEQDGTPGAGSSLHAVASASAVALTLTFLIADSPLTLAFGLSALGAAWVSTLRPLPALRWCAAGFVLLVLARMGGAWTLADAGLERFPDWQDILLRYAIPAAAFYYGGILLRRRKADMPAAILDFGAILLACVAVVFAIRLGLRGAEEAAHPGMSLAEAGLYTALAFAASMALVYRSGATTSPVYRAAAPISVIIALSLTVSGPMITANPVVSGEMIGGGALFNTLLPGYALPALLAGAAALFWHWYGRGAGKDEPKNPGMENAPFALLCGICAFVLGFTYVTLEVRKIFADGVPDFVSVSSAENWGYTIAWLLYGLVLLGLGIGAKVRAIRLGSAIVIMLAVAKAFLFDMSELEGIWRALSFMGLGVALIGIGLVYQRLLFGPKPGSEQELKP
ncbi:DUF2339 domain-containing protein [Labrys okinawensis]|nr:DUF2339 domain-containing protein [Labrys okinawensis]